MYDINLAASHFTAQNDAEIRDITVGGLLREIAAGNQHAVAMVDITDSGDCGQSWTYSELLAQAEHLAEALTSRFDVGEKVVVVVANLQRVTVAPAKPTHEEADEHQDLRDMKS